MSTLQIDLIDRFNKRRIWVSLRDNLPVQDLIQKLVIDLELPQGVYELSVEETGKTLPLDSTLKKEGIADGSQLSLRKKRKGAAVIPVPIMTGGKDSADRSPENSGEKPADQPIEKPVDKAKGRTPKGTKPPKQQPPRGKPAQEAFRPPVGSGDQPGKSGLTINFWHRPFPQPHFLRWIPVSLWFYIRPIIIIFILLVMITCYIVGLCVCRTKSDAFAGLTFSSSTSAMTSQTATSDQNKIPSSGNGCDSCSNGDISSATSKSIELESSETETPSFIPLTKSEVDEIVKGLPEAQEPYQGTCYVAFNTEKSPFDNVNVRKAFSYAVNRDYITEYATCECGFTSRESAVTLYPQKAYIDNFGMNPNQIPTNSAIRIKPGADVYDEWIEILSSTGYTPSDMEITVATSEGYSNILKILNEEWSSTLGVKVKTAIYDFDSFTELVTGSDAPQAFLSCNYSNIASPFDFLYAFVSGYYGNYIHWNAPDEYFQFVYQAYQSDDPQLYLKAEQMLVDEYSIIMPLYYYSF